MAHPFYKRKIWDTLKQRTHTRDQWKCQWPGCGVNVHRGRKGPRAAICDHKTAHRGNWNLFKDPDNLWTLCKRHHDRHKQIDEKQGYSMEIGADGYPVDPNHPFNRPDN